MKFGDPVTVTTGIGAQLAVFLWEPEGREPAIFLAGRVQPVKVSRLASWSCPACHGTKLFWGVRIAPRCAACQPPMTTEKAHLLAHACHCIEHLADKLDDPAAKTAMFRMLDEAVATGDFRQLVQVSLEALAGGHMLKHGGDR